jgi:galactose mutarotase-like enzyme
VPTTAARATIRLRRRRGVAAVTLCSGELEATFVPELNLLGTSLQLGGEEFLALPGGIGAYRRLHTTGLPLLAPWANRLASRAYSGGGVRVDLRKLALHADANGLPMHGTMSAHEAWDVRSLTARGRVARLHASFEYVRPDLLAAFPFPHLLETVIEVDGRTLSVATTIRSTSRRPVPVSFGYHPYFRLPKGRRAGWRLRLPRRVRLELDARGIPSGLRLAAPAESKPIGERTFDDLFALEGGRTISLEGAGRRLSVVYGVGYTHAQVFAPPEADFVCLEPMTAATNALVSGTCEVVGPGSSFTARFRIRPERLT